MNPVERNRRLRLILGAEVVDAVFVGRRSAGPGGRRALWPELFAHQAVYLLGRGSAAR